MSNPGALALQALIDHANQTTGGSDTTLTDAIQSLIDGYGHGNGCLELWKTVTIEENHIYASTANPIYWMDYFSIPEEDVLSGIIYILEIANDQDYATQHPNWHIWPYSIYFKNKLGEIDNLAHRTNTAIQGMSTGNYQHISAGAIVNIYKLKPDEVELYSVGTEIISKYIGRTESGDGDIYVGRLNQNTGEMWIEGEEGYPATGEKYGVSLIYIPVDTRYSYTKWMGYLYRVFCYDSDLNYLGYSTTPTDRNVYVLPEFPEGTKYIRIAIHSSTAYRQTIIVRTA